MAARAITGDELTLLRTEGQHSKLYLAVYQPNTIYTARLDALPASNDMVGSITYNTGSGTLADVKAEMTLWVGTSAGARDLGICRIRKAPISGTFYIGATSEIDWQSNCYLTVVDMFSLFPKVPKMDGGTLKLDFENTYSDQHTDFQPVPIMGTHAVVWLTGATVDVSFDSSDSWVFDSSIASRTWVAPGASATSGLTTNTPTLTYNAAGNYRVYCTVAATSGEAQTGIRHVFVFDANNMPYDVEITQSISGDYGSGGWSFGVKAWADAEDIIPGSLAILFSKDWYGDTEQSIGQITGRENILCVGYIDGESIDWKPNESTVEFNISGANEFLSYMETGLFALNIATSAPSAWDSMAGLTVDRAVWHLLNWRSNVIALMDFYKSGDARYAETIEVPEGDMWAQLNAIGSRIHAQGGVDKYGRLFLDIDPQCVPEADRSWAVVMAVAKTDWRDSISIERNTRKTISMLATSGQVTGQFGGTNILYSLSLGNARAQYGGVQTIDQLLLEDQAQANELAGLYCGWKNLEYQFSFVMPQNNRMIDLFPRQYLAIAISADETPRGIAYSGNIVPRSLEIEYNSNTGAISVNVDAEQETTALLAINGNPPDDSGADDWDDSGFPGIDMPDFTTDDGFIIAEPGVENPNHPKVVVIASTKGVFYTQDFDATNPTWKAMNNGFASNDAFEIANLVACPNGALYCMTRSNTGWEKIYRASALGGTWVDVFDASVYGGTTPRINGLGVSDEHDELVAICVGNAYVSFGTLDTHKIYISDGSGFTPGGYVRTKFRDRYTAIIFSKGHWYVYGSRPTGIGGSLASSKVWFYDAGGSLVGDPDGEFWGSGAGSGAGDTYAEGIGKAMCWGNGVSGYNIINDLLGTSQTHITTEINPTGLQAIAMAPPFVYGMGADGGSVPYKTTDSAATWQSVGGVIPIGSDVWENCGDNNRFIFGGGTTLRLTVDQGATYVEKSGNLTYIAALLDISVIRFVS